MITIVVTYTCSMCDALNEPVIVPARPSEMDVRVWVDQIMGAAIGHAHHLKHPHCPAKKMKDVKIPITNAEWVGGPAVQ